MSEDVLENMIKVQRAKMNLTQEQLADLIGVTRKTVNTIENGKFIPSTVLAIKMARVFGLPVEELFTLK
ncbi:helix-turn-helix transcriptional regulator [Cohnella soli]|uniref:Helix-turn-helix transcriptional regulator n=1 Tax=Cohnella soli TaxID=425005 RepID=A0ABW0HYF5_9BACL